MRRWSSKSIRLDGFMFLGFLGFNPSRYTMWPNQTVGFLSHWIQPQQIATTDHSLERSFSRGKRLLLLMPSLTWIWLLGIFWVDFCLSRLLCLAAKKEQEQTGTYFSFLFFGLMWIFFFNFLFNADIAFLNDK